MELKTKVNAEDGKQELVITRDFDLPVELLFKAHADPELFAEWMSNPLATAKVVKFESRKHGSFQLEAIDTNGKVVFSSNGVFHEFVPNEKITRTFEMENTPFPVQLEFITFEKLTENTSRLTAQIIFKSVEFRNQLLTMPFAKGLNMAHDRLQEIVNKLK